MIILQTNTFEFEVPQECLNGYPMSGHCDDWATEWVNELNLVNTLDFDLVLEYVRDCGVETAPTMDNKTLAEYLLWLTAGYHLEDEDN